MISIKSLKSNKNNGHKIIIIIIITIKKQTREKNVKIVSVTLFNKKESCCIRRMTKSYEVKKRNRNIHNNVN